MINVLQTTCYCCWGEHTPQTRKQKEECFALKKDPLLLMGLGTTRATRGSSKTPQAKISSRKLGTKSTTSQGPCAFRPPGPRTHGRAQRNHVPTAKASRARTGSGRIAHWIGQFEGVGRSLWITTDQSPAKSRGTKPLLGTRHSLCKLDFPRCCPGTKAWESVVFGGRLKWLRSSATPAEPANWA